MSATIAVFHARLHRWYEAHGRKALPWRNTCDPYAIYVSEIMLQQTQVKTVLERYYFPFLTQFPTLPALARAPLKDVLKAWQGLGYYHRAGNLHRVARQCNHQLPTQVDQLLALPGIGRNTAHAIAAFAFRRPVPVLEANVKRVLSRIFALSHASEKRLWEKAEALLNCNNPFDYNQAMMDLGALVCTHQRPLCHACPASLLCKGKSNPGAYPMAKAKKTVPIRRQAIVVKRNAKQQYYATPRAGTFLRGYYQFSVMKQAPTNARNIGHIRQQYSHFTLDADIFLLRTAGAGKHWYRLSELTQLPLSMAEQKILRLLAS